MKIKFYQEMIKCTQGISMGINNLFHNNYHFTQNISKYNLYFF